MRRPLTQDVDFSLWIHDYYSGRNSKSSPKPKAKAQASVLLQCRTSGLVKAINNRAKALIGLGSCENARPKKVAHEGQTSKIWTDGHADWCASRIPKKNMSSSPVKPSCPKWNLYFTWRSPDTEALPTVKCIRTQRCSSTQHSWVSTHTKHTF